MPIICQAVIDGKVCGYSNPDGLDFCDDCGSDLRNQVSSVPVTAGTRVDSEVVAENQKETVPQPLTLSPQVQASGMEVSEPGVPKPVDATPSTVADLPTPLPTPGASSSAPVNGHAKLVILRNGPVGKTYPLDAPEIRMGRWDADNGHFPEIDLTDDDIDSKVSRSHAKITVENGQYFIEDLGSLNGTFVNRGKRLVQGQKVLLKNGDELIVGKMFFRFETGLMC